VPKTQRPGVGIAGPLKEGFDQEPGSFSELAARKQGDRRDPVTVIIAGAPVAKGRPYEIATAHALVRALGEDRIQAILDEAFADADFRPLHAEVARQRRRSRS